MRSSSLAWAAILLCILLSSGMKGSLGNETFNVLNYGAVGDGRTDDSQAFIKAWNDACSTANGTSYIQIPDGKTYLLGLTHFSGPCNSSIHVIVNGVIRAPSDPSAWTGKDQSKWLIFEKITGLAITGPGSFDGSGQGWWDISCRYHPISGCNTLAPTMIAFLSSRRVHIKNIQLKNSPQAHIIVYGSHDVHFESLTISAPESSPNTDGIHIQTSQHISIQSSSFSTGDDCISIGDSTSYINISHIKCGPGHGVSIGSLGRSGTVVDVHDITVSNVDFYGSTNGARIKTWQVGRGRVSRVIFSDLNFTAVQNPIIIDQYYCEKEGQCGTTNTGVQISDVKYRRAIGTSETQVAINLNCSNVVPCTDITLDTIQLDSAVQGKTATSSCSNAFGVATGVVQPTSCLQ